MIPFSFISECRTFEIQFQNIVCKMSHKTTYFFEVQMRKNEEEEKKDFITSLRYMFKVYDKIVNILHAASYENEVRD